MLPLACACLGCAARVLKVAASCTRGPRLSLLPFNRCLAVSKHPASNLQPVLVHRPRLLVSYMPLANFCARAAPALNIHGGRRRAILNCSQTQSGGPRSQRQLNGTTAGPPSRRTRRTSEEDKKSRGRRQPTRRQNHARLAVHGRAPDHERPRDGRLGRRRVQPGARLAAVSARAPRG